MEKTSKFDVLVTLYIFGVMVAQLMGAKTFQLMHVGDVRLNASVAIFVMPLLFTLTDVVTEVYGRKLTRRLVRLGLLAVVLQLIVSMAFTALPASPRYAGTEAAYDTIFGTSIRFAIAALVAFAVSELLDVAVFAALRERLGDKALWLRNNVSNFVSQFVDAATFLTIAFYAFGDSFGANVGFITGLLIPYWSLRCLLSVFETPLVYIGVRWLKPDKRPTAAGRAKTA